MFSTAKLIFDLHLVSRRQLLKNHIPFQIDDRSKSEPQKGLIFSFVLDAGFGTGFPSSSIVKFMRQLVTSRMGVPNDRNVARTAHPSSRLAITAAIKFGRLTNDGPAQ